MSDPELPIPGSQGLKPCTASKGPNLALIYSLIAFALVAAIGFAMLIVLPFYLRR